MTVTRGVDNSTNRSHNDGAKFEPMITVGFWDDFYDAYDLDHTMVDGSHDITRVAMLSGATVQILASKILSSPTITTPTISNPSITAVYGSAIATGAEVTTGTDNTKIVTPKAVGDAGVNTRLKSKIITASRDMTAASGNVAYTGVGFTPTAIIAFGVINSSLSFYIGAADSAAAGQTVQQYGANTLYNDPFLLELATSAGVSQTAVVSTYDADGFTLTWTKGGSPAGTGSLIFLCFR